MHRGYYAIIPANVRYDKELISSAKLLYGEITALCNETGRCWASNSYFAELYGVNKKTISTWINQLASRGYITTEIEYKEGTKEILHRYIRINHGAMEEKMEGYGRKLPGGREENVNTPMEEKVIDNNTVLNNTINNTINNNTVSLQDKKAERIQRIFNHWVSKKIVEHRKLTSGMKSKINARLKENSAEDLLKAIDNYAAIRESKNHWYSYKFTLDNFMSEKNINKFLDIADPFNNFKVTKREYGKSYPRGVDHGKDEAAKRFAADNGIPF